MFLDQQGRNLSGGLYGPNGRQIVPYQGAVTQMIVSPFSGQLMSRASWDQFAKSNPTAAQAATSSPYSYNPSISSGLSTASSYPGTSGQSLADAYKSAYQDALARNTGQYNNIQDAYTEAIRNQRRLQTDITKGYSDLLGSTLGYIKGIDASQRQAINDTYAQQVGMAKQQLINSGLGNTTVSSAVQRGLLADKTKADIALTNQTQQLNAGYVSQLGLANLGYQGQSARDYTGLLQQRLNFMNTPQYTYPDASQYYALMQQQGAINQAGQYGNQYGIQYSPGYLNQF